MLRLLQLTAALSVIAATLGAQYHHPVYVAGGMHSTMSTVYETGLLRLDNTGATPAIKGLIRPGHHARFCMDGDNRNLLVAVEGASSTLPPHTGLLGGLFRFDPSTGIVSTVADGVVSAKAYRSWYYPVVDHNGDYYAGVYEYDAANPAHTGYKILKVTSSGIMSTAISSTMLGRKGWFFFRLGVDIDSGKVLVGDAGYQTSPTTWGYPVLTVNPADGSIGTWSTGTTYGWAGFRSMPQSHRTGTIQGVDGTHVYELKPGVTGRTTLATLTGLPRYLLGAGKFDLQTAAGPRLLYCAPGVAPWGGYLAAIDASTWTVTATLLSTKSLTSYDFEFLHGRHTSTRLTAPRNWSIRYSAPRFAGKRYVAVAGVSGVRPGIALSDGRILNLNFDPIVFMTLADLVPNLWRGGAGTLDSRGEATGSLDLRTVGTLGTPLWIAWVVLDPAAPSGIAFAPDTHVMRI